MREPTCGAARAFIIGMVLLAAAGAARAQIVLPEISVTAERGPSGAAPSSELNAPGSASEGVVTGAEINDRPVTRPGEVLEAVPGLIVTQHSGEGKANQYFLRGFNLDHGTDIAIHLDGMPINMRSHGHGQGYADLNFMIPELIGGVWYRKGPYFAEEGDFSSAGSVRLNYVDRLDRALVQTTLGSFGHWRSLAAASRPVGDGHLLGAAEMTFHNGPWQVGDALRKFSGFVRYSQGTDRDGFALTAMAYANNWTSTDQVPLRAVQSGLINRYGSLDPTDGGNASRFSLSGRWSRFDEAGASRIEAYAIRSSLNLWNNFTYFLDNPINGDQFRQNDQRTLLGFNASHSFFGRLGALPMEIKVGAQGRYDDIRLGLSRTEARMPLSVVRDDRVREASLAAYIENTLRWTPWLRTTLGLRTDWYSASVASDIAANSGATQASITSPKFGLVLGPFARTELFFNAGHGFHSNDARGTTIRVDPNDRVTPVDRVPLLVKSKGAEIGLRARPIDGLETTLAAFVLDFASENLFVGDAGTTEPSRPSRRVGFEWTNHWKATPWLSLDIDVAYTRTRFTDIDPAGRYVPGAPALIASAGFTIGQRTGWFGGATFRYFGPRPLIEDNSARSPATALVNARIGYRFDNGVRVQLDALNLLNTPASQIDYFYTSRLPGEPATGIADRHFHPVEPRAMRLTVAGQF
ncbi:MAG: TonB-dependent receptor [Rhizobiales bacterium]|nr:TonB-dependent receptor [Hyphomicrobiales bacterium]